MKKAILVTLSAILLVGWLSQLSASNREEVNFLLNFGQKVLIEGARRGERKFDWACKLKRTSNYVAIVQNDGANYRIVPVPLGKKVEKMCPKSIFGNAIRWLNSLHKTSY
ncbi:MAG: hypothetical protein GY866_11475 [Proteobacteria bacterium]|nr:hypothetical protein [Pseudomonadota bacterium]